MQVYSLLKVKGSFLTPTWGLHVEYDYFLDQEVGRMLATSREYAHPVREAQCTLRFGESRVIWMWPADQGLCL